MAVTASGGQVRTDVGSAPILPMLMIGLGGYLLWFGVHYWRGSGQAVWPSYPIKSVLQGKGLPANTPAATAAAQVSSYEATVPASGGGGGGGKGGASTPANTTASGSAQNMAKMLLSKFGWGSGEMGPLISLWNRESGWNPRAQNPSSGALGIAQALGHGTPGAGGTYGNQYGAQYGLTTAQAQAANSGSALQQIRWGLGYIKDRYGSPSAAWGHETSAGWYAAGGRLAPGQTGVVGEAGPEYITAAPGGGVTVTPGAPSSPREVVSGGTALGGQP